MNTQYDYLRCKTNQKTGFSHHRMLDATKNYLGSRVWGEIEAVLCEGSPRCSNCRGFWSYPND